MKRYGFILFVISIWIGYFLIQTNFWLEPKEVENLIIDDRLSYPLMVKDSIEKPYAPKNIHSQKKKLTVQQVNRMDINLADTNEFKLLTGIGSYRAKRIVSFRNALGGFVSVDQLGETYGLPDSVFQKIKIQLVCSHPYEKVKINSLPYDSLYPHPYITKQMAYFIMKYRREKGEIRDYTNLEQILDSHHREMLLKLKPYLDFSIYTN
ncbi:ComEA family DNA-binding protein [Membranihabitans marinus]|uniref:ComEA family DNA-binding protein n=1 Tax=Membranihabitans marinus TaxID=1227546 RepID=UPI001F440305|nr:helix-hairpin-helix domain-containing protein [Membranihabitans marinus]